MVGGIIHVYFRSATLVMSGLPGWQLIKGGKEWVMRGVIVRPDREREREKKEEGKWASFQASRKKSRVCLCFRRLVTHPAHPNIHKGRMKCKKSKGLRGDLFVYYYYISIFTRKKKLWCDFCWGSAANTHVPLICLENMIWEQAFMGHCDTSHLCQRNKIKALQLLQFWYCTWSYCDFNDIFD